MANHIHGAIPSFLPSLSPLCATKPDTPRPAHTILIAALPCHGMKFPTFPNVGSSGHPWGPGNLLPVPTVRMNFCMTKVMQEGDPQGSGQACNDAKCGGQAEQEQDPSSWLWGEASPSHSLSSHSLHTALALHVIHHVFYSFFLSSGKNAVSFLGRFECVKKCNLFSQI